MLYTDEQLKTIKLDFAKAILRFPGDIWAAAKSVDPRPEATNALVHIYAMDNDVQSHIFELRKAGNERAVIPTKDEFAMQLMKDATEVRDKETKLKYLRLVAEIMGYIEKPANTSVQVNTGIKQTVMVVPLAPSLDDWEATAVTQQAKLVNVSAT